MCVLISFPNITPIPLSTHVPTTTYYLVQTNRRKPFLFDEDPLLDLNLADAPARTGRAPLKQGAATTPILTPAAESPLQDDDTQQQQKQQNWLLSLVSNQQVEPDRTTDSMFIPNMKVPTLLTEMKDTDLFDPLWLEMDKSILSTLTGSGKSFTSPQPPESISMADESRLLEIPSPSSSPSRVASLGQDEIETTKRLLELELQPAPPSSNSSPVASLAKSRTEMTPPLPTRQYPPSVNHPSLPHLSHDIPLLTEETVVMILKNTFMSLSSRDNQCRGELLMTTFKLVFIPNQEYLRIPELRHQPSGFFRIPLACIDRVEREKDRRGGSSKTTDLGVSTNIYTKDLRFIRINWQHAKETEKAYNVIMQCVFPRKLSLLFAFSHRLGPLPDHGWNLYEPLDEYERQGALMPRRGQSSPWRVSYINKDYSLCQSYPSVLVVPSRTPDHELFPIAAFRSEGRVPVLTWGRQRDNASIWRSSQPKVGMQQSTCSQDEDLLNVLASLQQATLVDGGKKGSSSSGPWSTTYPPPPKAAPKLLFIFDCRPRTSAMANMAAGYGFELSSVYIGCTVKFCDIGNIHAVRTSLQKLETLTQSETVSDLKWLGLVEYTGWLYHIRALLQASIRVAATVHFGLRPVLVHCSHGWDRTSQVCSLAQILLDPFYRTIKGFQILIEKDWMAFGHPFHLRNLKGQQRGQQSGNNDQRAPIFVQFLDSVWQLLNQFASEFEFNSRYLLCIADHVYSCRFGTLLQNTEMERNELRLRERCPSLWTYLELNRSSFLNPCYRHPTEAPSPNLCGGIGVECLCPDESVVLRGVTLWADYYLRWCPKKSTRSPRELLLRSMRERGLWVINRLLPSPQCGNALNPQSGQEIPVCDQKNVTNNTKKNVSPSIDTDIDEFYCASDEMDILVRLGMKENGQVEEPNEQQEASQSPAEFDTNKQLSEALEEISKLKRKLEYYEMAMLADEGKSKGCFGMNNSDVESSLTVENSRSDDRAAALGDKAGKNPNENVITHSWVYSSVL